MNDAASGVPDESSLTEKRGLAFAHRGGIHWTNDGRTVIENTLDAFERAVNRGARGIEADIRVTRDGVCVIHHDMSIKGRFVPRPIRSTRYSKLPDYIPTIDDFYERIGDSVEVSLDSLTRRAGELAIDAASSTGETAVSRLWLCSFVYSYLMAWRKKNPAVKLVDSTPFHRPGWLLEKRITKAASAGLDAFNAHHSAWTQRLVDKAHGLGLQVFAWDVNDRKDLERVCHLGVDAIYSDDLDIVSEFQARTTCVL